jgi:hypothetical protein
MSDDMQLGAAFARPDRTAGIAPPRKRAAAAPVVPAPVVQTRALTPLQPVAAETPVQRTRPDMANVYLSRAVHARAKRYIAKARRAGDVAQSSFTGIVLLALADLHDRLPELVRPVRVAVGDGALFAPRTPQRRVLDGPQVQVQLTPGEANVAVLDGLVEQLEVTRSQMVDTVLDEWLPKPRRKQDKTGIMSGSVEAGLDLPGGEVPG